MRAWNAGEPLRSLLKSPITREQLKAYAESSLDHNPIHLDEDFAKAAGFPSVIAHGMLSMAFLGDFIRHHFPEPEYDLKQFKVRFKKVTFPGDILSCEGEIKSVEADGSLTLSLWLSNQRGETPTEGTAVVTPLNP